MEQKHIIFVILVLLTLGWIALSYSNIDVGANEEKILERESYRSSLEETEAHLNEKLDILRDDVESKMDELKDLLSEMAENVAGNIEEIQKTNTITDQKNVIEIKDIPAEPSVQDIEESPESFGGKIYFSNFEGEHGVDSCKKQESVFFLKTSKTGSTTLANILTRFGYSRSLSFLFGEQSNGGLWFINQYLPFSAETCFLGRDIPNRPRYDISSVHIRYNKTAIDSVLQPYNRKVSILRDPHDNFISSWKYYHGLTEPMRKKLKSYNADKPDWLAEITEFLEDPWTHLKPFDFHHSAYLFLVQPQMIFFGEPTYLLRDEETRAKQLVQTYINQWDADFAMIMILEDVDTSLAVLALKFCWEAKDMVHLKLNTMHKESKTLSEKVKEKLKHYLWADYLLYDHFKSKLQREIKKFGQEKVEKIKNEIVALSEQLSKECLEEPKEDNGWLHAVKAKPEKTWNQTCYLLTQQEHMVSLLQIEQILKWKKKYPDWRGPSTPHSPGNDVPKFCYDPNHSKNYHMSLATKEIQPGWGYWNFLKLEVNEFDLKQRPSPEILEIIATHKKDPDIFKHNFFIYNDPNKSPLKNMVVDDQLKKIM